MPRSFSDPHGFVVMAISFPSASRASTIGWRTPLVIVLCGCLVSMISFGPRATLGFFLTPMSQANDWGRDVFGLALAIQNILWGIGQPFAGAIADRYGTVRVLWAGGTFYAIGLILMAYSTSPGMLDLAAGVFIGFGLAGCSFSVVLAAFGPSAGACLPLARARPPARSVSSSILRSRSR